MDELYTVNEVSEKLKYSRSTIYRHVESGCFPHLRVGQNIRFSEAHIVAFLSRKKRDADRESALREAQRMALYNHWH